MEPQPDLDLLWRLADAADTISLPVWQAGSPEVTIKPDASPVTATDPAVERRLREVVAAAHPDDGFLGEEVGDHPGRTGRRWIVDGIDGTVVFIDHRPDWATLVGLVVGPRIEAGMVTAPAPGRGVPSSAERAWTATTGASGPTDDTATPLRVGGQERLGRARIEVWPPRGDQRPGFRERGRRLAELTGDRADARPLAGHPVPLAAMLVAEGRADAVVHFGGEAWDHAGPVAVVEGAGGRFTDLDGNPTIESGAGIYSNGLVHDAVVDWLADLP